MNIFPNPSKEDWPKLLTRPGFDPTELADRVRPMLDAVRKEGDTALLRLTKRFDGVALDSLSVSQEEIQAAEAQLSDSLKQAIRQAYQNISAFHQAQQEPETHLETMPGVHCWRKSVAIEAVGLYIPGGTAPLFSTVLMLAIPARIAGCKQIVLCSPPNQAGNIHPAILFAAELCGVSLICKAGGAQAVAAMAYGTESVPAVSKIFGPGNQYVTLAKQLVSQHGVAIDMPAGPSEVAIIADASAHPTFVAADLLSQAEHGVDSQVLLISTSESLVNGVMQALEDQLATLPRAEMARKALENSRALIVEDRKVAVEISNAYAPEHLILAVEDADDMATKIVNAGSVFLGHYTPESVGDYASGTNHTLPTNGYARAYSGVSLDSFVKKITFQQLTPTGLRNLGPTVEIMAEAEELMAHKQAVSVRLASLQSNNA
ncbi:MAG: histidinol dehydrogenase [Bacteroidota bacterium]